MDLLKKAAAAAKTVAPYLLIVIIATYMLHDIFQPGILTKSDNAVHLVEEKFLIDEAFQKQKWISGWDMKESAGMPIPLYTYQLGYWFIAFLYFVFGINLELAYKLALLFAYVFPATAIFFFLKRKFGAKIAFFPSLFYLFQHENTRMFLAGMWNNGIGLGFLMLLWYFLDRYGDRLNLSKATLISFVFAAVVLAHNFVAIIAASLVAVYFFIRFDKKKPVRHITLYSWIFLSTILLTLFYTYHFLETANWLDSYGTGLGASVSAISYNLFGILLSLKPHLLPLQQILAGNLISGAYELLKSVAYNLPMLTVDALAAAGIVYLAGEKHKRFLQVAVLLMSISLFFGSGFWFLFQPLTHLPLLSGVLSYRFVYYARVPLFILAAFAMHKLAEKANKNRLIVKGAAIAYALLFVVLLASGLFLPLKSYTETSEETQAMRELRDAWAWLNENAQGEQVRVLQQSFFDNVNGGLVTKDSILAAIAHEFTNLSMLGTWVTTGAPVERKTNTENGNIFDKKIEKITTQEISDKAKSYNIKYIVAVEPRLESKLRSDAARFKLEKKFDNFAIFSLRSFEPKILDASKPIAYKLVSFENQNIVFSILNNYEGNVALIKVAQHPYWHARIGSQEIKISQSQEGLMLLNLPTGRYGLELSYEPTKLIWPAAIPLLVGLMVLINKIKKFKNRL